MFKDLPFKLRLQHFAEPEGTGGTDGAGTTPPSNEHTEIDYDKLADVIAKRSNSASDAALRGYLKQQGLNDEQLNEAVKNYKDQIKQKEIAEKNANQAIIDENKNLKAQILNSDINNELSKQAAALGVNAEKLPFLERLIDRTKVVDDKGAVSVDKVKAEVETVLKAFPDFKGTVQSGGNGFQRLGGDNGQGSPSDATNAMLDSIFGVTKK